MDKKKAKYIASIIELNIFIIIALYLISKYITKYFIEDLEINYSDNKNNPLVNFFAPLFGKNKFSKNNGGIVGIMSNKVKPVFKIFLSFLTPIFSIINRIFSSFQDSINKLRSLLKPIRDFFLQVTEKFYKTIEKSLLLSVYSFNKLRNAMRRSLSRFNLIFHTLEHSRNSIQSIIKSPPVKLAINLIEPFEWMSDKANCIFCFAPNTYINLANNKLKKIKDLNIYDILIDNSKIISLQCFKNTQRLYNYNDIYLTGSHKIKEGDKWINVSDSKYSKLSNYIPNYVYCMSTTNGIIQISKYIFKDFSESINKYINHTINSIILTFLNKNPSDELAFESNYLEHGFLNNTMIYTYIGQKKISDIEIDDRLSLNDKVIGKIIINPKYVNYYKFGNIIVTSNTKVLHLGKWKNIEKIPDLEVVNINQPAINLVTESGFVDTCFGNKLLDYIEIKDSYVNKRIEELTCIA